MRISAAGLALIRDFEGCRLEAYRDPVGIWTIGYGHTRGVAAGKTISAAEAEALLREDLGPIEAWLNQALAQGQVNLSQGAFDALCSFAFNLGLGALGESTLWRLLGQQAPASEAAAQFGRWVYAGGRVLPGLVRRRDAEARLFLS